DGRAQAGFRADGPCGHGRPRLRRWRAPAARPLRRGPSGILGPETGKPDAATDPVQNAPHTDSVFEIEGGAPLIPFLTGAHTAVLAAWSWFRKRRGSQEG